MPLFIWLAATALVCALPLAWWSVGSTGTSTEQVRTNLAAGREYFTDMRRVVMQQSARDRVTQPLVSALANQARRIAPTAMVESLDRRIKTAGLVDRFPIERVLAFKGVGVVIGGALGAFFFVANPSLMGVLLLILMAGIGFMGPDIWMNGRARSRQGEIERTLADALDQITVCVESGLSFEAAVARVADTKGPLAEELSRLLQDIHIGIPRTRALENLLQRTDVADVRSFVHAFTHAERYGIPIAQVLRTQSSELREKRRQRAEERAMKIPVKLTFPLVLCILPALLIVIVGPAAIRITHAFGL